MKRLNFLTVRTMLKTALIFLPVLFYFNVAFAASGDFITTWKTDNPGSSASDQITIPTIAGPLYNYDVDWGDSSTDTGVTGDITHTYATPGTYTVAISGTFPRIYFNEAGDSQKILSIDQWGSQVWTSMDHSFTGTGVTVDASDVPDLSAATSLTYMFADDANLNSNLNSWDVSHITDFSFMFNGATSFNQPLNSWDMHSATNLLGMFQEDFAFDQDISSWDVSHVTDISQMFNAAYAFNQPLNSWNVSSVTNMHDIFDAASSFNQDLSSWDVSHVTSMENSFADSAFNQDISSWDVSNVHTMLGLFYYDLFFNQNISSWDVSHVTDMRNMFTGASAFNQPLNSWNVTNVTSTQFMFQDATAFDQPLNLWNTGNDTDISEMFSGASSFNQNLNSWNVSNVTSMNSTFEGDPLFNQPLNSWNTTNVTDLASMFNGASSFNQDISSWNVSNVTGMGGMFRDDNAFNQDLSSWNVTNVGVMKSMFKNTAFNQNLSSWDITNASGNVNGMFSGDTLSTANYDAILAAWSALTLENGSDFDAGNSMYCNSATQRASIISTYGWNITDGGLDPACGGGGGITPVGGSANGNENINCNDNGVLDLAVPEAINFELRTTNFYQETDSPISSAETDLITVKDNRGFDPDSNICGDGFTLSIQSDGLRKLNADNSDFNLQLGLGNISDTSLSEDTQSPFFSSPDTLIGSVVHAATASSGQTITIPQDLFTSDKAFSGSVTLNLGNGILSVFHNAIQKSSPPSATPTFTGNFIGPIPSGNYTGTITVTLS